MDNHSDMPTAAMEEELLHSSGEEENSPYENISDSEFDLLSNLPRSSTPTERFEPLDDSIVEINEDTTDSDIEILEEKITREHISEEGPASPSSKHENREEVRHNPPTKDQNLNDPQHSVYEPLRPFAEALFSFFSENPGVLEAFVETKKNIIEEIRRRPCKFTMWPFCQGKIEKRETKTVYGAKYTKLYDPGTPIHTATQTNEAQYKTSQHQATQTNESQNKNSQHQATQTNESQNKNLQHQATQTKEEPKKNSPTDKESQGNQGGAIRTNKFRQRSKTTPYPSTQGTINSKTTTAALKKNKCFNCGKEGHPYSECNHPRKKFCFRCGHQDVTLAKCPNCAPTWWENSKKTEGRSPR